MTRASFPVDYKDPHGPVKQYDLRVVEEGLVLEPGPDAPAEWRQLDWGRKPRVYWYHVVTPREGSRVLVTAGGHPLLVAGRCGRARWPSSRAR